MRALAHAAEAADNTVLVAILAGVVALAAMVVLALLWRRRRLGHG